MVEEEEKWQEDKRCFKQTKKGKDGSQISTKTNQQIV